MHTITKRVRDWKHSRTGRALKLAKAVDNDKTARTKACTKAKMLASYLNAKSTEEREAALEAAANQKMTEQSS